MVVISDTSPLNYLILIEAVRILPQMYGRVLVPTAVAAELSAAGAPEKTRAWFANPPSWLEIHQAAGAADEELDAGEAEAIALAKTLRADLLLIDERKGTRIAREREGLTTTGTLGVLFDAGLLGLIELAAAFKRLETETTFQAPAAFFEQLLEEFKKRKGSIL